MLPFYFNRKFLLVVPWETVGLYCLFPSFNKRFLFSMFTAS